MESIIMKSKVLLILGLFASIQVHASRESILDTFKDTRQGAKFSGQLFSTEDQRVFFGGSE